MNYSMFTRKSSATKKESLGEALQMIIANLEANQASYKTYNIIGFGEVLEGVAFYHELDQNYNCVGIEVEVETQFEIVREGGTELGKLEREVGFYSIWKGASSSHAPITFECVNGQRGKNHRFENGLGDDLTVSKVVFTMHDVQEELRKLGLSEMGCHN